GEPPVEVGLPFRELVVEVERRAVLVARDGNLERGRCADRVGRRYRRLRLGQASSGPSSPASAWSIAARKSGRSYWIPRMLTRDSVPSVTSRVLFGNGTG